MSTEKKLPEITAHRGASFHAPENTLAAYKLAWEVDSDAVEIDIYKTKDGRIIAMHDGSTARTTGVDMKIAESTFEELRALDAGSWKGSQYKGEKIPSLEEILSTVPDGKRLLIEIKVDGIVPDFLKVIDASGISPEKISVISFHQQAMRDIKAHRPSLQAYWLCCPGPGNADELIEIAKSLGVDGVDALASKELDEDLVRRFRELGMQVYCWTVDDNETALRMAKLEVDGITTNKPKEIMDLLKKS